MALPGKPRVLITGAGGFTGRHLSHHLMQKGWDVLGLDRSSPASAPLTEAVDILDTAALAALLRRWAPSHVVHLAGLAHVVGDPMDFFRVNVLGTESLMEAVAASGLQLQKMVVASSANVYGNARHSPVSEDEPLSPMNHYALSKVAMELMLRQWQDRWPLVLTRPFNYTGPGQSERFLFPKLVQAFVRRDPVIRLGNLDVARDLSDVRFVCEAYARLLREPQAEGVFNLCSGQSLHLQAALDGLTALTGHRPRIEVDPALVRRNEIKEMCGQPQRLFEAVGPIAVIAPLDIFRHMLEHQAAA